MAATVFNQAQLELLDMMQWVKSPEALAELKDLVRCASWTDEDYVDCVSTESLQVAIEALEREVSTDPDRV